MTISNSTEPLTKVGRGLISPPDMVLAEKTGLRDLEQSEPEWMSASVNVLLQRG